MACLPSWMASGRDRSTVHYTGCKKKGLWLLTPGAIRFKVPYVTVWQDLVENLPKWLKPFVHKLPSPSNSQVLVMETSPATGRN